MASIDKEAFRSAHSPIFMAVVLGIFILFRSALIRDTAPPAPPQMR